MRSKGKIFIPILLISCFLIYCWLTILFTDRIAVLRHYLGLILFLPLPVLFFWNWKMSIWATAGYLLIATFNGLAITADIITTSFQIGPIRTPGFQLLSLGILFLFFILNNAVLIDTYLDYKEAKARARSK